MKGSRRPFSFLCFAAGCAILLTILLCVLAPPLQGAYPPILSSPNQVPTGGSQSLGASGGCGGPYRWAIVRGGGSLSASTGDSVVYTAPAQNPDCLANATIRCVDGCGVSAEVTLSVNNPAVVGDAYWTYPGGCFVNVPGGQTACGCVTPPSQPYNFVTNCVVYHRCDGSVRDYGYNTACWSDKFNGCGIDFCIYDRGVKPTLDVRTAERKRAGCCPAVSMTPPTPGTQTHDLGGDGYPGCDGPRAAIPTSPNVDSESAVNLKSGNLYLSQEVAGLTFSYNSLASDDSGPVGRKWTHAYHVKLTPLNDYVTLVLQGGDGNVQYFRLSGGTYDPEPVSGDTSRIVRNPNGTYTRTFLNGVLQVFDSSGKLLTITDRNGNTTTLAYSGFDLTRLTDANGRTTTLAATGGWITTITDPAGRVYRLTYAQNGRLSSLTDPLEQTWQYTYDASGRMLTRRDPANRTVSYVYDAGSGRLLTATDPEGKTRAMAYTEAGTTVVTEKDGGMWTYRYDPTFAVKLERTDPLGHTTRYGYDLKRNLTTVTDPDGGVTRYTYDGNNHLTSVTDPLNQTTAYTYNGLNLIATRTDPRGAVTAYGYDAKGNLLTVTDPAGTTTFQYDARGRLTAITDAANRTVALAYDSQNNPIRVTDPLGHETTFTYDAAGNRLTATDPLGQLTEYAYNGRHQLIQVTDPLGQITRFTPDHEGNIRSVSDANGKTTGYTYNHRGQLTGITDALSQLTRLTYGAAACGSGCGGAEKLAALTDALNRVTAFDYDLAGRPVRQRDPLGGETTQAFDARGNRLTRTLPDGRTISYSYDAANRLTQKRYDDGSVTQYQYDGNGNMTYAGNTAIAYQFSYDAADRLTGITDSRARTIQYQYNAAGQRIGMTAPDGRVIAYGYDAAGRLSTLTAQELTFTLTYDAAGRRTGLTIPNATQASYSYDRKGSLTRVRYTGAGQTVLSEVSHSYDGVSNRLTRTDNVAYAREPAGLETMSHGTANELLSLNGVTYGYDAGGNRIQKTEAGGTTTYRYDHENRLVRVEIPGGAASVITYAYDPFGRRIEKNVNGTITRYLYDGEDILMAYDGAGTATARYLHGPGIDEPLALERDGQVYFYQADGLGSVIALADSGGGIAEAYHYDAFGSLLSGAGEIDQPYAYTGRELDAETGLYHYRTRHYDPRAGRFLQRDPIGFSGGDVNLYAYVGNNPVNWTDPWGLYGWYVHYHLTRVWALVMGIDPVTARVIAEANQSVDDVLWQSPEYQINYHTLGSWRYHFPLGTVDHELSVAVRFGMAETFGRYLHTLQDSFSHYGIGPYLHLKYGDSPDHYCKFSMRDQEMERVTKVWLKEFHKTLQRKRYRLPFQD